MPVLAPVHI
ncbi:hypothetical protein VTO73DRAFT_6013 [Trametes versicolor]